MGNPAQGSMFDTGEGTSGDTKEAGSPTPPSRRRQEKVNREDREVDGPPTEPHDGRAATRAPVVYEGAENDGLERREGKSREKLCNVQPVQPDQPRIDTLTEAVKSLVDSNQRLVNAILSERVMFQQSVTNLIDRLPDAEGILRAVKACWLLENGTELDDVLEAQNRPRLTPESLGDGVRGSGGDSLRASAHRSPASPGNPLDGPEDEEASLQAAAPPCPKCGVTMKLRNGSRGQFYGCSTYPVCKAIVNISPGASGASGAPRASSSSQGEIVTDPALCSVKIVEF